MAGRRARPDAREWSAPAGVDRPVRRPGPEPGPHGFLALQRQAGNSAVAAAITVQRRRDPVAHTSAKKVPGILAADALVAGYVGKEGGGPYKVKVHDEPVFTKIYQAYAKKKGVKPQVGVTNAFTDLDTGTIHLNKQRGDPGTIVHEALHAKSSVAFVEEHHEKINEGATELFTRRLCEKAEIERGDNYETWMEAVQKLVSKSSLEALAAAYFRNDTKRLEADLEKIKPGLWLDWKIKIGETATGSMELLDKAGAGGKAGGVGGAVAGGKASGGKK